jgi:multidrug resistance efflux pump
MKNSILVSVLVALILLAAGGGVLFYLNDSMNFITTDEAKVQGDLSTVSATVNGSIIEWNVQEGKEVKKGDVIAVIQPAINSDPEVEVTASADGTVLESNGSVGQFVAVGIPLAMTTPLNQLYVTANIEETDLQDVKAGADVKITVDAFPGSAFSGKIERIGDATTSTFSMLQASNSSGNYTKVVQKIPVKISLDSSSKLVPGLNATVKVSKQ